MDRRAFVGTLTGGLLAVPLTAGAQQAKKAPRIAFIWNNATEAEITGVPTNRSARIFLEGMRELGWVDGQNITIERRAVAGQPERFTALAEELVELHVDLIVVNSTPGAMKVAQVSPTIPIVIVGGNVTVLIRAGLIKSLARPGGNMTGSMSSTGPENFDKTLQLLKEVAPKISRVAHLFSPPFEPRPITEASRALKLTVLPVEVATPEGLEAAFTTIRKAHVDAMAVGGSPFVTIVTYLRQIAEFAAKERLPTIFWRRDFPELGGLMSFGTDWADQYRRAATFVDKILKGAKPAELPIEQPTKFELVINLKTAKALGLTIPPALLQRADEVIG